MSADLLQQEPASLQPLLAELAALGADRFDPVRFRYIQAMARRSAQPGEAVAALVANRALLALRDYQTALARARAEAQGLLEQVTDTCPETQAQARALFEAFDFKALKRLAEGRRQPPANAALVDLLKRLDGAGEPPGSGTIGELLHQQEAEALRTVSAATTTLPAGGPGELRAARYFRDARQLRHAEKLVSREVRQAPADSGPLNPQKLAVRSLQAMGSLSPAYLGRFVASLETLLWLEKAGENGKS